MKKLPFILFCISSIFISCTSKGTAEKLYLTAVGYYSDHDLQNAYSFVKMAEKQSSSFYQAYFLEAKILFLQKKYEDANKICQKLCKKYPEYTEARLLLIRCEIFLNKTADAELHLDKELSYNSTDWRVFYLYSLLYGSQKMFDKQLMMLNRTELALKDSQKVYTSLAYLWDELGVHDKAINYRVKSSILSDTSFQEKKNEE